MMPIRESQIHLFHKVDREVFCCLLLKLSLEPSQCLLIMSLWLWLENVGYPNVVPQLVGLSSPLLNAVAKEAQACLKCLEEDNPRIPKGGGLPLTSTLIEKDISLQLFHLKRFTAIAGIKSVLNNVSVRIFSDILHNVLSINNNGAVRSGFGPGPGTNGSLSIPGFPHPVFGNVTVPPLSHDLPVELWWYDDLDDNVSWSSRPSDDVRDEDKTMFLTFSRGFPVTEEEVLHLFTTNFGDSSVRVINMGEPDAANEQPLFATMVLDSVATVDEILMGKRIAKFKINGKHIWARKYENRV
ncbi:uncharacterized protein LOC129294606 [Prosopis cineraria]|uniref:uncharacterized protein LOC129294606 n=1 Tax=Prosopis cineraria TaxID=364024 RepID=UPI00240ED8D0|nr:uncharacterized protein LOC129294606 [Prosopis cineraria]